MANRIGLRVIIAVMLAMAIIGCEDESLIREELYSVKVLSITPDLIDGVKQLHKVAVEYNLQLDRIPDDLRLIIAFNTDELYDDMVYNSFAVTKKGIVRHTFDVTITPKDWTPNGEFQASAYLGYTDINFDSYFGYKGDQGVSGMLRDTLASDRKTFPVNDNYWSITWDLNGGVKINGGDYAGYPMRVAKDAVLVRPYFKPTKDGLTFVGWYTDSALTQNYDFSNSVTADLNLYAKWEELAPEHLYGTWLATSSFDEPYTLTISANSVELVNNKTGGYLRYSNVAWAQQPTAIDTWITTYSKGLSFTGTRVYDNKGYGTFSDAYLGFIALSITIDEVFLRQDAATNLTSPWNSVPGIFKKQRLYQNP